MKVAAEPVDDALLAEAEQELLERYGEDTEPGAKPAAGELAVFLVARDTDGHALGCGALRRLDDARVEIKRMYVRPPARGRGVGRMVLAALESEARSLGATHVLLETGPEQPEALRLYTSAGYQAVPCFGAYAEASRSHCFERVL